jgi:heme/copper-type cytochrome/quinol oxidase subunit 2
MRKRQVDALTIKSGPAEDGLGATAPNPATATPIAQAGTDFTTWIVAVVVVVVIVVGLVFLYMRSRRKSSQKQQ